MTGEHGGTVEAGAAWTWSVGDDDPWFRLARFVAPEELPVAARPVSPDLAPSGLAGASARERTLREVWRAFVALGVPYQAEAWSPGARQRVRDPKWVLDEGGTCLDLVLTFAAMVLGSGLRPYLVVDPVYGRGEGHALVAVDLSVGPGDGGAAAALEPAGWFVGPRGELKALVRNGMALLDCTHGAADLRSDRGPAQVGEPRAVADLAAAREHARGFLDHVGGAHVPGWTVGEVALVDVDGLLRARRARPHGVDTRGRPAISAQLPQPPPWTPYPVRQRLIDRVARQLTSPPSASRGLAGAGVVLHGLPGAGKSRLAHELATQVSGGAAWWLTSNDERTLRRSLATASARESGRPLEDTDLGRDEEAATGLARLADSRLPWLVVLDNANCDPSELRSLPRPRAHLGQRLVVTTLPQYAQAWCAVLGGTDGAADEHRVGVDRVGFEVEPLAGDDLRAVGSSLPAAASQAAAGSVLLVRAYQTLAGRHPGTFDEALAASAGSGAARLWEVFRRLEPDLVVPATRAAWLPPDAVPARLLGDRAVDLAASGLITGSIARYAREPLHDLHRSVAAAARATDPDPVATALPVVLDAATRRHLDGFGDTETLDRLATVLVRAHRGASTAAGLGPALVLVAELLELYGCVVQRDRRPDPEAGWSAEEVLRAVQDRADLSDAERADCLHGQARAVNQDTTRNGPLLAPADETADKARDRLAANARRREWVEQALGLVEQAAELRRADPLLLARSEALRGLLLQKRARFLPAADRLALLRTAYDLLGRSHRQRTSIIHERRRAEGVPEAELDHDRELARSIFNLAGVANSLAVATPAAEQAERAGLLDSAAETYRRVLAIRRVIYGATRPSPHVLACVRGLGLVAYQRAWLLAGSGPERLARLRQATAFLVEALEGDERLDAADGNDVTKTLHLLAKVTQLRLYLVSGTKLQQAQAEAAHERSRLADHDVG